MDFLADFFRTIPITILSTLSMILLVKLKQFQTLMQWRTPVNSKPGILILSGLGGLIGFFLLNQEVGIWSLIQIQTSLPTLSLPTQIVLWLNFTHLLSYATHGMLFIFLWWRFQRFLPALFVTWFEIAISEFMFIGSQTVQFGFILQWTWPWYTQFLIITTPFLILHKTYDLSSRWLTLLFLIGVFSIYINPIFNLRDPYTWDPQQHAFRLYPELVSQTSAWLNMLFNRIGKLLMTFSFLFVRLKQ